MNIYDYFFLFFILKIRPFYKKVCAWMYKTQIQHVNFDTILLALQYGNFEGRTFFGEFILIIFRNFNR